MVGHGDLTDSGADTDFSTVFGNLLYIGNDHGGGSGLVPHDTRPDTFPPKVIRTFPADGATMQPLGSRVTVHLTDVIDGRTVTAASFIVRPVGGAPLAGNYSLTSINSISFGANDPLLPDTTYEISLPQGGLKDVMQNGIAITVTARFSTGATVDTTPTPAGTGGSGPAGGANGAGGNVGGMAGGRAGGQSGGQSGAFGGGGNSPSGGNQGSGGLLASGGASASGGSSASGGATGSGGVVGSSGTGGKSNPMGNSSSGGCGCEVGRGPSAGLAGLLLVGLVTMRARGRGTRRRRAGKT